MAPDSTQPGMQIIWLLVLAVPIAAVAWTVTHEEIFREWREYAQRMCRRGRSLVTRKCFYIFTCEYCFSHYVTALFLLLTRYRLLLDDWRGYVLSFFALVWVANLYMSIHQRLRVDIRAERAEAELLESNHQRIEKQPPDRSAGEDGQTARRGGDATRPANARDRSPGARPSARRP